MLTKTSRVRPPNGGRNEANSDIDTGYTNVVAVAFAKTAANYFVILISMRISANVLKMSVKHTQDGFIHIAASGWISVNSFKLSIVRALQLRALNEATASSVGFGWGS